MDDLFLSDAIIILEYYTIIDFNEVDLRIML